MPQIILPLAVNSYDLYERLIAQRLGTPTDQSALVPTSILPRTCAARKITYPNTAPNTTFLLILDANGSEVSRCVVDTKPEDKLESGSGSNSVAVLGCRLKGPVDNAVVDIDLEIA